MAVRTVFPKLAVSVLAKVSAQPWVHFCAVVVGALTSIFTDFVFMFLQELNSELTEPPLVVNTELHHVTRQE